MPNKKEQMESILRIVHAAIQQDQALRQQFEIGDKFRFIRDRLETLRSHTAAQLAELDEQLSEAIQVIAEDEQLVYVYLYNAHGISLPTWQKMLLSSVFYEYSVNRPIYHEQSHIEAFIRSRPNKPQHAYLTFIVKKAQVLTPPDASTLQDAIGGRLLKIREGSLQFKKLVAFMHNGIEYTVKEDGQVTKKD